MMAINPMVDAAPYLALLGVSVMVVAAVILKYPSIKVYRQKRNIIFYAAIAIVLSLIAYQACDIAAGPDYIAFSSQRTQTSIYSGQQNQFSITCSCNGLKDASFYLVVAGENATLQANGQPGYVQLNATAIQVPFSFHGGGEQTKPIFFTAAENVSGISFYSTPKFENHSSLLVEFYLSDIHCIWDSANGSFVMGNSIPIATAIP